MRQGSAYDEEVGDFSPPSGANENLTCDLLVAGGGLSGLSAADAAVRRGVNVVVIEKGIYGKEAASGLSAGQFLTGWAKPVDIMLAELARQDMERGLYGDQARRQAERRVRAFLRRTVEGCQRLEELDRDYNLRASVQHGACTAAMTETDMASLKAAYQFMERSNLRGLMPLTDKHRPPFFEILSARQLRRRYGTAEGFYAGGVIDRFGGSFRPRKFLIGLARALQKQGVRFFRHTEAQALDFSDHQMTVFCGNGATIAANTLFMANAYARQRIFPALRSLGESDIKRAWAGRVYYTLDDYPFVERRHGGRVVTFAAPSDHGNALALRIGQLVGNVVTHPATRPTNDNDERQRRHSAQQLRLFENFPKGLRLRPGRRYQEAAFREPEPPIPNRPEKKSIRNPLF
jgi:glycine/D-amino acid oxidase-like deaminating enzyme